MRRRARRGTNLASELRNAERLIQGADEQWGWGGPAGRERVARRVRFIADSLQLRPGMSALELGCGTAIFTEGVARTGADIVAVDLAESLLEEARRKLAGAPNVQFICGDLMDPATLEGRSFDAVYCVSVLHHLDLDRALPVIRRALRPGARFAFSEPNLDNPLNRFWYYTDDAERRAKLSMSETEMAFTRSELRSVLEQHGFTIERIDFRDFLHPSTPGALVGLVDRVGRALEDIPLARRASGSLWVAGRVTARS